MHLQIPSMKLIFPKGCQSLDLMLVMKYEQNISGEFIYKLFGNSLFLYHYVNFSCNPTPTPPGKKRSQKKVLVFLHKIVFLFHFCSFVLFRSKYELQEFLKPSLRILSNSSKQNSLQTSLSRKIMDSFRTTSSSEKTVCFFHPTCDLSRVDNVLSYINASHLQAESFNYMH